MRLSALLISLVFFLLACVTSATCTGEESIKTVHPVSVRVHSVAPRRIQTTSSGRRTGTYSGGGGYSSGGGRYSSGGK